MSEIWPILVVVAVEPLLVAWVTRRGIKRDIRGGAWDNEVAALLTRVGDQLVGRTLRAQLSKMFNKAPPECAACHWREIKDE